MKYISISIIDRLLLMPQTWWGARWTLRDFRSQISKLTLVESRRRRPSLLLWRLLVSIVLWIFSFPSRRYRLLITLAAPYAFYFGWKFYVVWSLFWFVLPDVKNKWESSSWGRKLIVQKRRASLNDFDRFKLMLAKIKVWFMFYIKVNFIFCWTASIYPCASTLLWTNFSFQTKLHKCWVLKM